MFAGVRRRQDVTSNGHCCGAYRIDELLGRLPDYLGKLARRKEYPLSTSPTTLAFSVMMNDRDRLLLISIEQFDKLKQAHDSLRGQYGPSAGEHQKGI